MLNSILCISVNKEDFGLPRERIFQDQKWVKHVYCQWSRFHVLSYFGRYDGSAFVRCNEPDCIANAPAVEQKRAADVLEPCQNFVKARDGECYNCGCKEIAHR